MKVLGIIPARGGSKGIPKKNVQLLGGKPLLLWTIEAAQASSLARLVVSTDDQAIAAIAREAGVEVIMRPPALATDQAPTLPVLQHVLQQIGESYDAVMTLQPTSPFRNAKHIDEAIALLEKHPEADTLVSVQPVPHQYNPMSVMQLADGWLSPWFPVEAQITRRQDKPAVWARNGAAIYLTRTAQLATYIFGGKTLAYQMSKLDSIDLDDAEDWEIAEALIARHDVASAVRKNASL